MPHLELLNYICPKIKKKLLVTDDLPENDYMNSLNRTLSVQLSAMKFSLNFGLVLWTLLLCPKIKTVMCTFLCTNIRYFNYILEFTTTVCQ